MSEPVIRCLCPMSSSDGKQWLCGMPERHSGPCGDPVEYTYGERETVSDQPDLPAPGQWPCQSLPPDELPPRLVGTLYVLMRDHVQPGDLEQVMLNVRTASSGFVYTNPHLEAYARALASYLIEGTEP